MHTEPTSSPHPGPASPVPVALYLTPEHREHLAALTNALNKDVGMAVLTADTGDTTDALTRHLQETLGERMRVASILQPRLNVLEFLTSVCRAFRVPLSSGEHTVQLLQDLLLASLRQTRANGRRNLLIVNEAQSAPFFVLRQLLPLCQPDPQGERPLQVLMVGQPGLLKLLSQAELAPVQAAVGLERRLEPLSLEQTQDYVRQRLSQGRQALDPEALEHIHAMSEGKTALIDQWYEETMHPSPKAAGERTRPQELDDAPPPQAWRGPRATATTTRHKGLYLGAAALLAVAVAVFTLWPAGDEAGTAGGVVAAPLPPVPVASSGTVPETGPAPVTPVTPAVASPPASAPVAVQPPVEPQAPTASAVAKRPALADLVDDAASTWPVLGIRWNARLSAENPCDDAMAQGLQCFRKADMDLALLRLFDRPGLLQLQENGVTRWVHLVAMDDSTLTLSSGALTWRLPTAELPAIWTGFYSTLWRLPDGQTQRVFTAGTQDPAGRWLDEQLKQFQARGQIPATPDNREARLLAFQKSQQLYGDGKAVPSTFMVANRLAGIPEPRLTSGPVKSGT
jgi:general secretion pathway protein A